MLGQVTDSVNHEPNLRISVNHRPPVDLSHAATVGRWFVGTPRCPYGIAYRSYVIACHRSYGIFNSGLLNRMKSAVLGGGGPGGEVEDDVDREHRDHKDVRHIQE